MERFGLTIPYDGAPLAEQRDRILEAVDLGYTDLWSSEANGTDGFTPLAMAAAWLQEPAQQPAQDGVPGAAGQPATEPTAAPDRRRDARLGVAIVPAFTRGPALLAQSVAAMAEAAPGRFAFGIGTSSDVIVERWNGIPFEQPYQRTRDMVRFLKAALTGEKVDQQFDTIKSSGFRLGRRPPSPPQILVAALRPGMLRLAGRESDGAIINWLSADDVKQVAPEVGAGKEIVARLFVCPSEDADAVRSMGRFAISSYLNVPVYAAFHEWLGRGPQLQPMWDAWKAGDRKAAVAAIPDEVVDDLIVHGSPDACREHIQRYVDNGVTTPVLAVLPFGVDPRDAVRRLAPANA